MQTKVHKMLTPTQPIPSSTYKYNEPYDKVYVVAGNVSEYNNYKNKKISEGYQNIYYYVTNVDYLRGLSEIKGVFIGTWKSRSDIREIEHQINIIKQKMASASAASVAAGIIAQEIDKEIIQSVAITSPGSGYTTGTSVSSIGSIAAAQTSILSESAIRDMMKQYIDEALKNPSTLGGI